MVHQRVLKKSWQKKKISRLRVSLEYTRVRIPKHDWVKP
jgi:hypothetical protein